MSVKHARADERGQVAIVWIFGSLAVMALLVFILQLGNVLRWTIRAQNAADSAARAAIAAQTQPFNQMQAVLYASSVEEYRLRHLVQAISLTANNAGGCARYPSTSGTYLNACADDFNNLRIAYNKSLTRFSADVALMQRITGNMSLLNQENDAQSIVASMSTNCSTKAGVDCAFGYTLPIGSGAWVPHTPGYFAMEDAFNYIHSSAAEVGAGTPAAFLQPAKVEVVVCHVLPPVLPSIFGITMTAQNIIATSAVQSLAVTSEQMQPGSITNPKTGATFQQTETPIDLYAGKTFQYDPYGNDWYSNLYTPAYFTASSVNNGGAGSGFTGPNQVNEFSEATNWWSSATVRPFLASSVVQQQGAGVCHG